MNIMKKNIFLTGSPSSGKTVVIKQVIERMGVLVNGFYTEEERAGERRVGFVIKTLDGREGYLAHRNIKSVCNIRKYGISIRNIETIAAPSITPVGKNVILLDGIGKMECFSGIFKRAVLKALNSSNIVIGTITLGEDDFIMEVMGRGDVEIHEVTRNNRKLLPDFILGRISDLHRHYGKNFPSPDKRLENTAV
jgi:nucleoside-triphosphatase THEP1